LRRAYLNTQGAVLYRAGQHREAVKCLEEAIRAHGKGGDFHDWVFLAMAHGRLREHTEARRWLERIASSQAERKKLPFSDGVEVQLLHDEAKRLLDAASAPR